MRQRCSLLIAVVLVGACSGSENAQVSPPDFYGTLELFAAENVYFIVTDRFVDGDPANNQESQGGPELATFDRPIQIDGLPSANIGYLGGDFKGVLDNAGYIAEMGFTAIWLTPIIDNPDEAFTGGKAPGEGGSNDKGKTGYHGYWGVNFFKLDEHLPSPGLDYADLTKQLRDDHGIKTVLDIVCNHGSPSFSMPHDQPGYGEIYGADGKLLADHGNLHPGELDSNNPLHDFFRHEPDVAELSDLDYDNPQVLDYCVEAHSKWIEQGAAAIRIDTIKHMPIEFWKAFAERIRERSPGLFMFSEAWSFDAEFLSQYTYPENGGISVLDFPGRQAMYDVFGSKGWSYARLASYLHLDSSDYHNPYELMTFYDNHDMTRLDADNDGFIDANNWLFTSRGIPIVYYGSEIGFRAGADQHAGNRDYYGQESIAIAKSHRIHNALASIATLRKNSIALQRGLQLNLRLEDDSAAFFRVYQHDGISQTALVLLNKGDTGIVIDAGAWLFDADWRDAISAASIQGSSIDVPAHAVRVLIADEEFGNAKYLQELIALQAVATTGSPHN